MESMPNRPGLRTTAPAALATVLLLLLTAPPAAAFSVQEQVDEAEAKLRASDYPAALELTEPLLRDVGNRMLQTGEKAEAALGTVMSLHALALAGVERQDDAEWYWYLAQSLRPDLASTSLEAYGAAGERLEPHRFAEMGDRCRLPETTRQVFELPAPGVATDVADHAKIEPPKKLAAEQPVFPRKAREAGLSGMVVLGTVINAEGRVEAPCLVETDWPILAWAMSEAVRDWRFEPARRDGEPVDVYYNLTTSFTLSR
jgi:TonB family protein